MDILSREIAHPEFLAGVRIEWISTTNLKAHEVGPEPIVINGVTWGPYKWPRING